jgi:hypothetical protein
VEKLYVPLLSVRFSDAGTKQLIIDVAPGALVVASFGWHAVHDV